MLGLIPPYEKLTTSPALEPLFAVLMSPPDNKKAATSWAAF